MSWMERLVAVIPTLEKLREGGYCQVKGSLAYKASFKTAWATE